MPIYGYQTAHFCLQIHNRNSHICVIYSMAQVISDLAFLNAYSSKISSLKNPEKIVFLEECFLYIFAAGLSPYNDAFLTYSAKVPNIQKCRTYETWAVEILPP